MLILANGFPKSGTNLIKKVLGALGYHHEEGLLLKALPKLKLSLAKVGGNYWLLNQLFDKPGSNFIHSHVGWTPDKRVCQVVHITRNPRNTTLSFLRWAEKRNRGLEFNLNDFQCLLTNGMYGYEPWLTAMATYQKWWEDERACCVRFEKIFTDGGKSVRRILAYLGEPEDKAQWIYDGLYGNGKQIDGKDMYQGRSTWTGELTNWETCPWWNEALWQDFGGPAVERTLGY